jgi:branched-chain amino acid transport system permease protein
VTLSTFLIQCLNGLQYGLLLFLVASGLTLLFGIMGVINLAHGAFYMAGAYLAYALTPWVHDTLGAGFLVAVAIGVVLSVAFGALLEWVFFSFLYERDHLQQVLMTYGLILVFEQARSLLLGDQVHAVAAPPWLSGSVALSDVMNYPVYRLFVTCVSAAVVAALFWVIHRTRFGMAVRAGSSDRPTAQAMGIPVGSLYRIVFAAGFALAVLAGMIAAPVSSVYPGMGDAVLILSLVVTVIGGIGSIRGTLLASLLVAMADTFGKVLFPQASGIAVYCLMALVLIWKPEGLFRQA